MVMTAGGTSPSYKDDGGGGTSPSTVRCLPMVRHMHTIAPSKPFFPGMRITQEYSIATPNMTWRYTLPTVNSKASEHGPRPRGQICSLTLGQTCGGQAMLIHRYTWA